MGVPALFRWLSRKYPKIVLPVVEEEPVLIPGRDGEEPTEIPVDIRKPNPNGTENDCLYLDMNGIVHPCTHPEGKPAPKTEEDMMMEVFKYTERVVNMARPRKVLLMAIDGVAPRAKMNQQRSRRFRAADEAKTKAKEKEEVIKEWEAMGKELSDEYKNETAWDSNAITPGTPFMDLLAAALRYWVAYKMNTDPGWANLQVIISDASVPGEGEHKIMDFVRRQRSQPGYDPNTTHVFYGLDADLIMLSLATHEPNFKILREDVFAQAAKRGCHKCGEPGHHSSKCTSMPGEKKVDAANAAKSSPLKPFIFLDVSILREYLQIELDVPGLPFAFDVERAIDDWVFMIFFVGNDFLPHLPSLDIREGAIDMLLKIWRTALPQMGGYLTDNGSVDLKAAQVIMNGLAEREDDIFRKRKENEEREEAQAKEKRRRIDLADSRRNGGSYEAPPPQSEQHSFRNGIDYVPVLKETQQSAQPVSLASDSASRDAPAPTKPNVIATPKPKNPMFVTSRPVNASIRGGFIHSANNAQQAASNLNGADVNKDLVANRAAIRKANLSAADMLRAELAAGKGGIKKEETPAAAETAEQKSEENAPVSKASEEETETKSAASASADATASVAEIGTASTTVEPDGTEDAVISAPPVVPESVEEDVQASAVDGSGAAGINNEDHPMTDDASPRGKKRSADEAEIPASRTQAELQDKKEGAGGEGNASASSSSSDDEDDADAGNVSVLQPKAHVPKPLKMLGGNMVEQEDTVKLWEPGYKARYYEQKFSVGIEDADFRRSCAHAYVEGLCWVLAYYYKGCPSWTWYYPHHFAPFASDFTDLESMDIKFEHGQPFRPFEQLMGVFPAASRKHIPAPFQTLMIEEDSEIIDFYPEEFHVDMNGKKMLWQGVALLPFIDQKRLLDALAKKYPLLSEDEVRRNSFGNDVIFVNEDNPLYNQICSLYMKRKVEEPMPVDATLSKGIRATILPNGDCIPNSTYVNPFTTLPLSDLQNDRSISAVWFMPTQLSPHRSILLPGYKPSRRVLTPDDISLIHRGLSGEDGGRDRHRRGPAGDGFHAQRRAYGDGPGFGAPPRRDARDVRDVRDPRRSSGGYNNRGDDYGYSGRDQGAYSGYSQSGSSYRGPGQSGQPPAAYGGYGGGSQQGSSYGGYGASSYGGASNGSSYGGYGSSAPAPAPYSAPPPPASYGGYGSSGHQAYQAPPPPAYGGAPYGSSSQGSYGQPYSAAPPPAPAPYGGYGSYGGAPPPQQGYRPPSQPQYTNRGAIVPPHLQGQQPSQHQRWSR